MKTTLNKAMVITIVVITVAFVTMAVIHIVHLTNQGLINWNN